MNIREIAGSAAMATRRSSVSTAVLHDEQAGAGQLGIRLLY
jgi:hypothetical protein